MQNTNLKTLKVILLFFIIASCSKQSINEDIHEDLSINTSKYYTFDTVDDLKAFDSSENPMNEIEGDINFTTLKDLMEASHEALEGASTIEEIRQIVRRSNNTLSIIENENGELEVKETIAKYHALFQLVNKDGIVKVGNEFYRLLDDKIYINEDYNTLLELDVNNLTEGIESFKCVEILNTQQQRWGDLNTVFSEVLVNDNKWCKNDRKIIFNQNLVKTTSVNTYAFGVFTVESKVSAHSTVTAYRKGIPCFWYKYKTTMRWVGFRCEYDLNIGGNITTGHIWEGANIHKSSVNTLNRTKVLAEFDGRLSFDIQWTRVEIYTTHDGMAGDWINFQI